MCSHSEYIEDHTSGDVVCLTCGLVLDKIFLSSQKKDFDYSCVYKDKFLSKNVKEIDLHENVTNFLYLMNIHFSFCDDVQKNAKILLSKFSYFPISLIVASACFVTLSKTKHPITLSRLENMVCENKRDKRNLFKMVVCLQEPSIFPNLSSHVANSMLHGLDSIFMILKVLKRT